MPRRSKGACRRPADDFRAAFGDALTADFTAHGAAAIAAARDKDPVTYLKICASILPKPAEPGADPLGAMSDDQLLARARTAAAQLGFRLEPQSGDPAPAAEPATDR